MDEMTQHTDWPSGNAEYNYMQAEKEARLAQIKKEVALMGEFPYRQARRTARWIYLQTSIK